MSFSMYDVSDTYDAPELTISEQDGVRSLHLGGSMVQSAMRIAAPNALELVYTQCMMGFMLFHPKPGYVLMIGLGGGSLAKFVYHYLPEARVTVIEPYRQVIMAARQYFYVPHDDARFAIVEADGARYITAEAINADIIMVDGFDDGDQVQSLCSQEFYDHALQALNRNGMLVVNLLSRDSQLKTLLQRIENSFDGHIIAMMAEIRGNLIVFAFRNNPGKLSWKSIHKHAQELETAYPLPFREFVARLRKY
ncbi:MAG: polyamine aminopropyltransferase [Nitrosomonas sp.]|nr:polyamine aminopropyltransferase [Nitrosomonas sp.]